MAKCLCCLSIFPRRDFVLSIDTIKLSPVTHGKNATMVLSNRNGGQKRNRNTFENSDNLDKLESGWDRATRAGFSWQYEPTRGVWAFYYERPDGDRWWTSDPPQDPEPIEDEYDSGTSALDDAIDGLKVEFKHPGTSKRRCVEISDKLKDWDSTGKSARSHPVQTGHPPPAHRGNAFGSSSSPHYNGYNRPQPGHSHPQYGRAPPQYAPAPRQEELVPPQQTFVPLPPAPAHRQQEPDLQQQSNARPQQRPTGRIPFVLAPAAALRMPPPQTSANENAVGGANGNKSNRQRKKEEKEERACRGAEIAAGNTADGNSMQTPVTNNRAGANSAPTAATNNATKPWQLAPGQNTLLPQIWHGPTPSDGGKPSSGSRQPPHSQGGPQGAPRVPPVVPAASQGVHRAPQGAQHHQGGRRGQSGLANGPLRVDNTQFVRTPYEGITAREPKPKYPTSNETIAVFDSNNLSSTYGHVTGTLYADDVLNNKSDTPHVVSGKAKNFHENNHNFCRCGRCNHFKRRCDHGIPCRECKMAKVECRVQECPWGAACKKRECPMLHPATVMAWSEAAKLEGFSGLPYVRQVLEKHAINVSPAEYQNRPAKWMGNNDALGPCGAGLPFDQTAQAGNNTRPDYGYHGPKPPRINIYWSQGDKAYEAHIARDQKDYEEAAQGTTIEGQPGRHGRVERTVEKIRQSQLKAAEKSSSKTRALADSSLKVGGMSVELGSSDPGIGGYIKSEVPLQEPAHAAGRWEQMKQNAMSKGTSQKAETDKVQAPILPTAKIADNPATPSTDGGAPPAHVQIFTDRNTKKATVPEHGTLKNAQTTPAPSNSAPAPGLADLAAPVAQPAVAEPAVVQPDAYDGRHGTNSPTYGLSILGTPTAATPSTQNADVPKPGVATDDAAPDDTAPSVGSESGVNGTS